MDEKQRVIAKRLFILGGIANFGALGAFLPATIIDDVYPAVFSPMGVVGILLWGMAYIAVSRSVSQVRPLLAVFVIEKIAYVISWIYFLIEVKTDDVWRNPSWFDTWLVANYGVIDIIWGIIFMWAFVVTGHTQTDDLKATES